MDWTVSSYPKDTIYTHEWTIEDFLKAMYRNDGKIDSPPFKLPGLQWSFFLRVTRSQCDRKRVSIEYVMNNMSLSDIDRYKDTMDMQDMVMKTLSLISLASGEKPF